MEYNYVVEKVYDMSQHKGQIEEKCNSIGKQFIKHFSKIYNDRNCITVHHWVSETQNWFNYVLKVKLKGENKYLDKDKLIDWFFQAGDIASKFMIEATFDQINAYNNFVEYLLNNGNVYESLIETKIIEN